MTKRFKTSKKVWINYGLFLMKNGQDEAARKLLQRSFQSLPERKRKLHYVLPGMCPPPLNVLQKLPVVFCPFGKSWHNVCGWSVMIVPGSKVPDCKVFSVRGEWVLFHCACAGTLQNKRSGPAGFHSQWCLFILWFCRQLRLNARDS